MSMRFKLINDWQYFFNKNAIGGRFASFTFINICYMNINDMPDIDINGITIVILGIGVKIRV